MITISGYCDCSVEYEGLLNGEVPVKNNSATLTFFSHDSVFTADFKYSEKNDEGWSVTYSQTGDFNWKPVIEKRGPYNDDVLTIITPKNVKMKTVT